MEVHAPLGAAALLDRGERVGQVEVAGQPVAAALDHLVEIDRLVERPQLARGLGPDLGTRSAALSCSFGIAIPAPRRASRLPAGSSNSTAAWQTS